MLKCFRKYIQNMLSHQLQKMFKHIQLLCSRHTMCDTITKVEADDRKKSRHCKLANFSRARIGAQQFMWEMLLQLKTAKLKISKLGTKFATTLLVG